MSNKTPEEMASAYAEFATISEHTYAIAYHSYLGGYEVGYQVAHEQLSRQVQFLETQLREAHSRILRLEAEKQ